jgi:integrase
MAASMLKTKTPGIYRRGSKYVFSYRVEGAQRWESFRTLDEARRAKSARSVDIERGEFEQRSRETLHAYISAWIETYEGNGKLAIREGTRIEYRRQIDKYVLKCPAFPTQLKLTEVTPRRVADFGRWLREQTKPAPTKDEPERRVPLSDATVRRIMAPLQACLRTAVQEGVIRSNPARDVKLPARAVVEDADAEQTKAMTTEQLAMMLALIPTRHRLLFRVLAATGMRISELLALQWRHLHLDGSAPHLDVRRALVKGRMGPPKSRHGRRSVPLDVRLVRDLRSARRASEWPGDDDLVFPAGNGKPLHPSNLYRDALKTARDEADLTWVGFHTFRHTCASMLFAAGRNAVQVQRWLGHHSPAFTLSVYVHLLNDDLGEPLTVEGVNSGVNMPHATPRHSNGRTNGDSQAQSAISDSTTLSATGSAES